MSIYFLFYVILKDAIFFVTKLEEALGLRKVVQESNKVFEIETLSADTFLMPSVPTATPAATPSWSHDFKLRRVSLWLAISLGQAQADTYDLVSLGASRSALQSLN